MLNAGFQYLEQRDANDTITKDGVVGKNSPFATSDNSGIYDIIAEDLRWLKENIDDVKDTSDLIAIKQSVTDMYNTMKNDSSFGEATAKAQAEEAKKQAQAALESANSAKTYYDDITAKSTEVNNTIAEIKTYIEKAEALNASNKELEQSIADHTIVATHKANESLDNATRASNSASNAATSEANASASEAAAKTSETNAAKSESDAKAHMDATALSETHAKTSETNAKASETASKTSETNAKTSEINARTSETNASNSADLSKAWAESSGSPDSVNDTDSTTGKTQSSKTWAIYSKDRAISAFTSETHAKTSETNAKTSETNAANSATNSASSATASANSAKSSATSATNAKTSETNATTSASNAKASETNAKASETNSANSAQSSSDSSDLSKAWSVSTTSPDNIADKDSPTNKTQSSRTWALYSRDRAISAFKSETNAKASETASKTSETNAADSASKAKVSETSASTSAVNAATSASNAKASETNAKASETNASASKTDAATSETNAKSYMATAKEYMQKAQEALAAAQAIQSLIDTSKANAEKCLADVEAVKESLAKMITYQGSVDNYSDLPTNPQVGYSYNVKNADKAHGVNAGDNLVWNGTDWDNFGSYVDMSLFAELGKDVRFNTVTATLNGNAATATKLQTARTLSLTGKAAGSTTFDGSANASINVTSVNADTASKLSTARKINITGNATGSASFDGSGDVSISTTVNESKHAAAADTATKVNATAPNGGTADLAFGTMAVNDYARIRVGGKDDNGWLEIATADGGNEPIYVRQYGGAYDWPNGRPGTVTNEAAILDSNGNTKFPHNVTAANFVGHLAGNADSATNADTVDGIHADILFYNKGIWAANNWATIGTYQVNNNPPVSDAYGWGQVISSSTTNGRFQLYASHQYGGNGRLRYRTGWDDDNKQPWNTILDSENYNLFAPTKTGTGASGTWGINISGNANTANAAKTLEFTDGGGAKINSSFHWVGLGGQPQWLWGSNDEANNYVYDPSNFHVASANTATSATTAGNVSGKIYYSSDSPSVATDKLFTVKQAHAGEDNVPNNGLVIQSGPTGANYNGKLYITDNGGDGVWIGGVAAGKEVGWTRLVENKGTWGINISGNAASASSVAWNNVTGKPSGIVKVASWDGSTLSLTTAT